MAGGRQSCPGSALRAVSPLLSAPGLPGLLPDCSRTSWSLPHTDSPAPSRGVSLHWTQGPGRGRRAEGPPHRPSRLALTSCPKTPVESVKSLTPFFGAGGEGSCFSQDNRSLWAREHQKAKLALKPHSSKCVHPRAPTEMAVHCSCPVLPSSPHSCCRQSHQDCTPVPRPPIHPHATADHHTHAESLQITHTPYNSR